MVLCSRSDRQNDSLLDDIKALGGQAIALQLDFSGKDTEQDIGQSAIHIALDHACTHFGGLNGILHLAGLPGETMIQRFDSDNARRVLNSKIGAVESMLQVTRQMDLDMLVLYSSVTGMLGGFGQCEYTAANAYLDVAAAQASADGLNQVIAINWDTFKDTGMAFNALNGNTLANTLKETVVIDHPFLGDLVLSNEQVSCFKQALEADKHWVLNEHLVMTKPTVPGTTYVDMAGAAFTHLTGKTAKSFAGIYFMNPLAIDAGQSKDVYTLLKPQGRVKEKDQYSFEIGSFCPQTKVWLLHVRGDVCALGETSNKTLDVAALTGAANKRYFDNIKGATQLGLLAMEQNEQTQTEHLMKYGQRWDVFDKVWVGQTQAVASLTLPGEYRADINHHGLHPSMLDCALSFFRPFVEGGVYIPFSIDTVKQYRDLPADIYSVVSLNSEAKTNQAVLNFTVQLLDSNGLLLVEIDDFSMHKIEQDFAESLPVANQPVPPFVNQYRQVKRGLKTAEALDALMQVVQSSHTNTIVATPSFAQRYLEADKGDMGGFEDALDTPQFVQPRPDLNVDYVAPSSDEQKQLAAIWCQMLGLEKVGIQDDFFDLGGNSLILMQVHKQLQSTFDKKISVVELYDCPTIDKLCQRLFGALDEGAQLAKAVADKADKQKMAAARRRRGAGRSRAV